MFAKEIGIDLGTANSLVYVKGKGVVINEPSVVAVNMVTNEVMAVGNEAKEMLGRTPGTISAVRPMQDGVIADFEVTQAMIKRLITKAAGPGQLFKPTVIICIPYGVTEVEKRAVEEVGIQAGAKEIFMVYEPMAAAIGSGLPVGEPAGSMIVDIGGGTSEIAVVSLGGIVICNSIRVGGDAFDTAIVNYIKREHSVQIGERTAEEIKMAIGSAYPFEGESSMEIKGRDLITGLPKVARIRADEVRNAMYEQVSAIIEGIKNTLENTPPELAADIMDRGIMLAGGGALLRGLDRIIEIETKIKVNIADEPLNGVIRGIGKILEGSDKTGLKRVLEQSRKGK